MVNGEGIPLAEYQAEVERYLSAQSALGVQVSEEEARARVLDDLIAQVLLAQGARERGFQADDALVQERIEKLSAQVGGAEALSAWQAAHGYTPEAFTAALRRAIEAAWMRDQILAEVPLTTEQVHVRQILLYNEDAARTVLEQLNAGADFDELAAQYDPLTRGDLGWFPRGYLLEPAIEEAAFSLQPGQVSEIIVSRVGYHIIKVLERDPRRPLSPDALLRLQELALSRWVEQRRQQSEIVFVSQD